MNRKKRRNKIILKLSKKELDFLNKFCAKKPNNISRSMTFNLFLSFCKNLPIDVNGVKNIKTFKKEILNSLKNI